MSDEEKKIIIDEDWKTQVQREKEQAATPESEAVSPDASPSPDEAASSTASDETMQEMPPANLEQLVSMLATSAMVHLGQIPDPVDQETTINLPVAKYYIDLLDVMEKKTKGNLSNEETAMLQTATYQLRMVFVAKSNE